MTPIDLWIALIAALLGCYFAACHAALKTFSRKRLTDLLEQKGRADQVDRAVERVNHLLIMTGLLRACLGIIVVLAIVHDIQTRLPGLGIVAVYAYAFLVSGVVLGVFIIAIPTSWAAYRQEKLLAWSLPILMALQYVFYPIVAVLHVVDPIVRRISGVDLLDEEDKDKITDEVLSIVEDHDQSDTVDDTQKDMLEAVFDLPKTAAAEIMTPRTDIEGIEIDSTLDEIRAAVIQAGHSRVPVYRESLDDIVGMLYARDLITFVGDGETFDLKSILREPFLVPESKPVSDLLAEFKARKIHIAIVLDEYGGTAGLVTIEDILEEIVGEIQDEYEGEEDAPPVIRRVNPKTADVEARVEIDTFNDELGVELPEDEDYDTVGGFVFSQLGHIPEPGEAFEFEGIQFTVTEAERTKVLKIRVELAVREVDLPAEG